MTSEQLRDLTPATYNAFGVGHLPGYLGLEILTVARDRLTGRLPVRPELMAPNGFLHAGTMVTVADSLCGYGTLANLPDGATGFTTIELKSNFLSTVRTGALAAEATPVHTGRTTQVWDAVVTDEASGRKLAVFRCTQLVLWPQ